MQEGEDEDSSICRSCFWPVQSCDTYASTVINVIQYRNYGLSIAAHLQSIHLSTTINALPPGASYINHQRSRRKHTPLLCSLSLQTHHVLLTKHADHPPRPRRGVRHPPDYPLEHPPLRPAWSRLVHPEENQIAQGVHHLAGASRRGRVSIQAGWQIVAVDEPGGG